MTIQGLPCWYELMTTNTDDAAGFYAAILPWGWTSSSAAGFDYRMAATPTGMVAGMMKRDSDQQPVAWSIYFAVTSADATADQAKAMGAMVIVPPTDIPGTGRFAILLDPMGAAFCLLQPLPMADGGGSVAFDQVKPGHGNWHELVTPDPAAALAFYGKLFGFAVSRAMPMGPDMTYTVFNHGGTDLGGMFTDGKQSFWKPYFGVDSAAAVITAITAAGGTVLHGPDEVPGGAFTVQARDPQGAVFALVGGA